MANVLAGKMSVPGALYRTHIVYRHNTSIIQLTAYLSLHFGNTPCGIFGDADFAYSIGGIVHDIQVASATNVSWQLLIVAGQPSASA